MGLHSQLHDVSSESIPLLLVALIATSVSYLRFIIVAFLQFLGFSRFNESEIEESLNDAVGSGFAGLIVLSEQLNLNRIFSYRFGEKDDDDRTGSIEVSDCVVCLSGLREGEQVRRLPCRHVFHKQCLDGWLDHLNFNCPLCRTSLLSERRVSIPERRVGGDLFSSFSQW